MGVWMALERLKSRPAPLSPCFPFRDEHARLVTSAPPGRRQPPVPEHGGEAAAGPAGVAHPIPAVTHHSGARAWWGWGDGAGLLCSHSFQRLQSPENVPSIFGFLSDFQMHRKCVESPVPIAAVRFDSCWLMPVCLDTSLCCFLFLQI